MSTLKRKIRQLGALGIAAVFLTVLVIGLGSIGVFGSWLWHWRFWLPATKTDDQLVIVGTAAAVASFLLVVIAGIVALLAYLAATGTPDLDLRVVFGGSEDNLPVLLAADEVGPAGELTLENSVENTAHVTIFNRSKYSARNPGLRIELDGLTGLPGVAGWTQISAPKDGSLLAIQWDGGANFIIHGNWERGIQSFSLVGVREVAGGRPKLLRVTVVADGVRPREWRMPVEVLRRDEYQQRMASLDAS